MQDMSGPLAAIVGPEYVRGLGEAVAVAPGNTEEIAAVLRLAVGGVVGGHRIVGTVARGRQRGGIDALGREQLHDVR